MVLYAEKNHSNADLIRLLIGLFRRIFSLVKQSNTTIAIVLLAAVFAIFHSYTAPIEQTKVSQIIAQPRINDIYFMDFRKLSDDLRPNEKYRIAKVVDITGDIVSLKYGNFYYARKNAAVNAIRYGQLRYKDYFSPNNVNLSKLAIIQQHEQLAIYDAQRPKFGRLFGNSVNYEGLQVRSSFFVPGLKENAVGEAFLNDMRNNQYFNETQLESAFNNFQRSAELGHVEGQINLAQMYINGQHVAIDFKQALYWLEQAALQSNKRAILKYQIVCQQIVECNVNAFFHYLIDAGVNLKVRDLPFTLQPHVPSSTELELPINNKRSILE